MNKLYSNAFFTLLFIFVFAGVAGTVHAGMPLFESSIRLGGGTTTIVCDARSDMNQCYRVDISEGDVTIKSNTMRPHNVSLDIPEGYKISGCARIEGNKCYFYLGPKQSVTLTVSAPDSAGASPLDQVQEDAAQQALETAIQEQQINTITNTIDNMDAARAPVCTYDSGGSLICY